MLKVLTNYYNSSNISLDPAHASSCLNYRTIEKVVSYILHPSKSGSQSPNQYFLNSLLYLLFSLQNERRLLSRILCGVFNND